MKSLTLVVVLLASVSVFAASDVKYTCVNKKDNTDKAILTLNGDVKKADTIQDANYSKDPSELGGMAPEDYPVTVAKNHTLASIDSWGDGDTDYFYADIPDTVSTDHPARFHLEIVEQSDRLKTKRNQNGDAWYIYDCTKN